MLILTIATLVLAPTKFRDHTAGDEFTFSMLDKYMYSAHPVLGTETGTRTTAYSKDTLNGKPCLKERTVTNSSAYGHHHTEIYAYWRRITKPTRQILAYSYSDKPPIPMRTLAYREPKGDPKPGSEWYEKLLTTDGATITTSAKALRWETVTVPAGTFRCLVVTNNQTASRHGLNRTTTGTAWWSPVIGGYPKMTYVETEYVNKTYGTLRKDNTFVLTSYKLAGRHK